MTVSDLAPAGAGGIRQESKDVHQPGDSQSTQAVEVTPLGWCMYALHVGDDAHICLNIFFVLMIASFYVHALLFRYIVVSLRCWFCTRWSGFHTSTPQGSTRWYYRWCQQRHVRSTTQKRQASGARVHCGDNRCRRRRQLRRR